MKVPHIQALDRSGEGAVRALIDGRAKPVGSLGRLEGLGVQIALIRGNAQRALGRASLIIFAGDHGLTAEGVTAFPSAVSSLIAQTVLDGQAGANLMAAQAGAGVVLVDAGLLRPLAAHAMLIDRRIAPGTANSRFGPAMTGAQCNDALIAGMTVVDDQIQSGVDVLALGEIGIGNSSAAALVGHAVTGLPLDLLVGPGAGLPPGGLAHKRLVLGTAYDRAPVRVPTAALSEFAGFEMVMMVGAMLQGAARHRIVLVDGFIATACAAAAIALEPNLRDYLIYAHCSAEPGHQALLDYLKADPLLDLGLRLGEGTGAALAIPLVRAASGIATHMASLSDVLTRAGVSAP
jgi:nicotinate-nucleotide--dimethylbenzimidazole phosphoribosyltransferase